MEEIKVSMGGRPEDINGFWKCDGCGRRTNNLSLTITNHYETIAVCAGDRECVRLAIQKQAMNRRSEYRCEICGRVMGIMSAAAYRATDGLCDLCGEREDRDREQDETPADIAAEIEREAIAEFEAE